MFKKIYAFQKLMLFSCKSPFKGIKRSILGFIFIFLMITTASTLLGFNDHNIFLFPFATILLIYSILQSEVKLYEQVPVSNNFTLANFYLFSITSVVLIYLFSIVSTLIFMGLILFLVLIQGGSITWGSSPDGAVLADNMTLDSLIFLMLLFILIIFIGTTISIIRNNKVRYISMASVLAILFGFLYALKLKIPMPPYDDTMFDFVRAFGTWNGNSPILLGLGVFTLLAVPISVKVGHWIYFRERGIQD